MIHDLSHHLIVFLLHTISPLLLFSPTSLPPMCSLLHLFIIGINCPRSLPRFFIDFEHSLFFCHFLVSLLQHYSLPAGFFLSFLSFLTVSVTSPIFTTLKFSQCVFFVHFFLISFALNMSYQTIYTLSKHTYLTFIINNINYIDSFNYPWC